ncbi:EipA family protein [Sphingomonadaceae bacterium G21617-S1]|nr:EipA family protein [Sphingomonadaceae bacterium G21617-S1]
MIKGTIMGLSAALALVLSGAAPAQMRTVDPNQANDLAPVPASEADYGTRVSPPPPASADETAAPPTSTAQAADTVAVQGDMPAAVATQGAQTGEADGTTYAQDDVLSAAEGVFGRGAEGLAKLVEKIFAEQGRPNAYIAGREAGGAIIVGVRYGSGTLFHKVEGQIPIYWTGPSLGFDLGANGAKSFVLVYNLFDSADIFRRFPAVEGTAYIVGGFTATYLRRGDVVLIPIRLGVGWRLGVNVGYMNFTRKSKSVPF